eukprot:TRINITY_DN6034_c0_g1_i1.p1 TRINITY_DN6034_c0_g1~~TRINITY_DN6034_c0_g1_i1.p1  ORF type:complete len:396 (-),score=62.77 TRINITY_DN6034_c0_g1_i1:384-1571(-)
MLNATVSSQASQIASQAATIAQQAVYIDKLITTVNTMQNTCCIAVPPPPPFGRVGIFTPQTAYSPAIGGAVADPSGQYIYIGSETASSASGQGLIFKVSTTSMTVQSTITLNPGENSFKTAILGPSGTSVIFAGGSGSSQQNVVKITLNPFGRDKVASLLPTETFIQGSARDPAGNFGYFSSWANGIIVKVDLVNMVRVGAVQMQMPEENVPQTVAIDPSGTFLYAIIQSNPVRIVKINLSSFTRVGYITLNYPENGLGGPALSAANHPTGSYLYVATSNTSGTNFALGAIVRVRLSDFVRLDSIALNGTLNSPHAVVIRTDNLKLYFSANAVSGVTFANKIVKVDLATFSLESVIDLNGGEQNTGQCFVMTPSGDSLFLATTNYPGKIVKIATP